MAPTLVNGLALVAWGALFLYLVLGGADFGAGLWELAARGPGAAPQRQLIERALAPVWEANHVWLILIWVILFTAFPSAFARLCVALHLPLTLLLIGIVIRGSGFVFRQYGGYGPALKGGLGRLFAGASLVTPWLLGAIVGAISSGTVHFDGLRPKEGFVLPWIQPFALAVGTLTVALCALIAAVYLACEATDADLARAFGRRALLAQGAVIACGAVTLRCIPPTADHLRQWLWHSALAPPMYVMTGQAALSCIVLLLRRRYLWARVWVWVQTAAILGGWGVAQYPYLIAPEVTLTASAAPEPTLRLLAYALAAGAVLLFPALGWLLWVFKRQPTG